MSLILPHKIERINTPFIVACEGFGDACLIEQLLKLRRIDNCRVGCPSRTGVGGDGKDYLNKYLAAIALAADSDLVQVLKALLVIVDADLEPKSAFDFACSALRFAEFPVPDSPFAPKYENGLKVAVYLIPGVNEVGTLEDLLLRSAFASSRSSEVCVESFLTCIGKAPEAQPNVVAKMKMSALVAASFPGNPWATPGLLLRSSRNDFVPLDSPHFRHLADFLVEFCVE